MNKVKWIKDSYFGWQHTTYIDGYKVDRTTCNSGTKFYYVHYIIPGHSHCHWLMSDKMHSLSQCRSYIKRLIEDGYINEAQLKERFKA